MNTGPLTGDRPNARQKKAFGNVIIVSTLTQHVTLPKINQKMVPEDTYWVYDPETNTPKHLYTRLRKSDSVDIAWTTCGACYETPFNCRCPNGIQVPRSVEYIWDKNEAEIKGEEWTIYHPHYYGSLVRAARTVESEASARETLARRGIVTGPPKPAQKVLTPPAAPSKRKPRVRVPQPEAPNLEKIDAAAAKSVDDKMRSFAGQSPKRRPRRKTG